MSAMRKKAAIVIGINGAGELPILQAAVSGAKKFGKWLDQEGFEVCLFVDEEKPVTVTAISDSIAAYIEGENVNQLVIYFAGHGFLQSYSELWMLSGAPSNANEAISVRESVELARDCGISNVVIVSDACRSTPQSLQSEHVRGSLIFPNERVASVSRPEIDRYLAALPGDPALEMIVDTSVKQYEGVFTHCFLCAYKDPSPEMIKEISTKQGIIQVIPNRRLKDYLCNKMPALMRERGVLSRQTPDAIVESGEDVYIGKVYQKSSKFEKRVATFGVDEKLRRTSNGSLGQDDTFRRVALNIRDVAQMKLAGEIGPAIDVHDAIRGEMDAVAAKSGFDAAVRLIDAAQLSGTEHFETRTGFKVFGAPVCEALGLGVNAELLQSGDGILKPAYIRLGSDRELPQPGSVVIQFQDRSGTVLAGLADHIGTVVVEKGKVMNVSYVPSDNSCRWMDYQNARSRLEKLRAIVAAAARYGVFRVDRENAHMIADKIRVLKGIDPTLGLYAAYAYSDVGLQEDVASLLHYMEEDLAARLFDVAMLTGGISAGQSSSKIVPFCPMLSQGWSLFRVKRSTIPDEIKDVADYLKPSLWTTFNPRGMDIILRALKAGRIKEKTSINGKEG